LNASKTAVLIDSGCDLNAELREKYDIKVIALKIFYGTKMYNDGVDIDPMYVYENFHREYPKTSTPNMQEYLDVIEEIRREGYENIIGITISSGLSGTYNTMRATFAEVEDMKTFAFDTKNISIGSGMYAVWAAKALSEGASFDEVVQGLKDRQTASHLCFYMDTLEYLQKGGRITPSVALVGKVLHLKPIISCNEEGVYYTVGKIRGQARGVKKLFDEVVKPDLDPNKYWFAIMNGDGQALEDEAKRMLYERIPAAKVLVDGQITATLANNTGPGLLGICAFQHTL
jgi:DegV family protein with EDD domain